MNLTIRHRLFLSNLAAVFLAAVVASIGYGAMLSLETAMNAITVNGSALKQQLQADMAHDALRADVLAALIAGPDNAGKQAEVRRDHAQHAATLAGLIDTLAKEDTDAALQSAIPAVRADVDAYLKSVARMIDLAFADPAAARQAQADFMGHFRKLETSMGELSDTIGASAEATRVGGHELVVRSERLLLLASLISVMLMVVVGQLSARAIRRPLEEAVAFAGRIADGDLGATLDCNADDRTETGRLKVALQRMRANLHGVVSQVRGSTDAIETASGEIASGNLDLSRRTEQQAGALEETAASIEELAATVKQNADSALQANTLTASASQVAVKGGEAVARVVDTMGAIHTSSRRIVDITGTIESIAF
jgi:methyl-accepting chemotaxis protein